MFKKSATLIVILFLLAACRSATQVVETPNQGNIATQIAQTVQAELTAVAQAATAVPDSPTPETQAMPTLEPQATEAPDAPTATPTLSPTATKTPLLTDPKQILGAPTWQDPLDSAANWYLYEDDHTKIELDDGNLVLNAKNADGWSGWALSWPFLADFYLETTMTPGDCVGLDRYGLVFRAQNPDEAYLFGVSCDGNYSLRRWDGEFFTMIQIWTSSPMINPGPGQSNVIGVLAQGKTLAMYVNSQFLGMVADDRYKEGSIGLFVGSVNTVDFQVAAQEITFWELPVTE